MCTSRSLHRTAPACIPDPRPLRSSDPSGMIWILTQMQERALAVSKMDGMASAKEVAGNHHAGLVGDISCMRQLSEALIK